jgi:glycosyltransferase involved in cell wall biosynthesis
MEMRPALDHFAGIPQETRLLFALFGDLPDARVAGLLNAPVHRLPRGLEKGERLDAADPHRSVDKLSRIMVEINSGPRGALPFKLARHARTFLHRRRLQLEALLGGGPSLTGFDPMPYRDFIWENLFAKTLPPSDFAAVTSAEFAVLGPSYRDLQIAHLRWKDSVIFPRIDTSGYDVFIGQTPWPSRVHPDTRLVVRYHDAIPMFLAHTISSARRHQSSHYLGLLANQVDGVFACTSEYTRGELLRIFPALETRSPVIHDIVSHNYFPDPTERPRLIEIVRNHLIAGQRGGESRDSPAGAALAKAGADPDSFRYLLIVSTIEPRKNYARAVAAWERARNRHDPDLKLVVVGSPGWSTDGAVQAMRSAQENGRLFHLTRVPSDDLRALYGGASAVLCPSVTEGFDFSGVEAMLSDAPVLASDIPVHREVYGDACLYFDPYSPDDMAAAIARVLGAEGEPLRRDLRARGLVQGARYTREAAGPRWEKFFEDLKSGRFGPPPARFARGS